MVSQVRHCSLCEGMVWVVDGEHGDMYTTREAALEAVEHYCPQCDGTTVFAGEPCEVCRGTGACPACRPPLTPDELEARTRPARQDQYLTDSVMDYMLSTDSDVGPLITRLFPQFVIDWPMRDFFINALDFGTGFATARRSIS